jgi:prenyltransferase beta subunit
MNLFMQKADSYIYCLCLFLSFLSKVLHHNNSHLASTYCALAILKIVGYDFSSIDSETILTSMRNLQQPDGR